MGLGDGSLWFRVWALSILGLGFRVSGLGIMEKKTGGLDRVYIGVIYGVLGYRIKAG